jgi:hypothetical protein
MVNGLIEVTLARFGIFRGGKPEKELAVVAGRQFLQAAMRRGVIAERGAEIGRDGDPAGAAIELKRYANNNVAGRRGWLGGGHTPPITTERAIA